MKGQGEMGCVGTRQMNGWPLKGLPQFAIGALRTSAPYAGWWAGPPAPATTRRPKPPQNPSASIGFATVRRERGEAGCGLADLPPPKTGPVIARFSKGLENIQNFCNV
jgi:hypothetical protein